MLVHNINNTFFEGIYKDVWRKLIPHGLTEVEGEFIMDVAGLEEGSAVLDIMCGYGRHALDLARRGVDVTAIDNALEYIEEIKEKASQESLPVRAVCSDVIYAELTQSFDAAICMGNSFAFFHKEDATALLKKIAAALKPGGIFVLNSWMIAEIAIKFFKEREWYRVDQYKYLLDYQFHFYPTRIESEHTILCDDGRIEVIQGVDYIFTLAELEAMFREAGLKTIHLYSNPRKKKFAMGDGRIYIIAEKAAE